MRTGEIEQKANDWRFYIDMLRSNECLCGRYKKQKLVFCYRCYKKLPVAMQRALYNRLGDGFEEAFEEAVKYLGDDL